MKKLLSVVLLLGLVLPALAPAQSVTTGSFSGTVVDSEGKGLPGVTVKAVHVPTMSVFETQTRTDGRFDILYAKVGGPYTITASLAGFSAPTLTDIIVRLGRTATSRSS